MIASLHGVQGGDEGAFARLYGQTNPLLLRYLRVASDLDPASLALTTWGTLLHVLPGIDADDDDDWLEVVLSTARRQALAPGATAPAAGGPSGVPARAEALPGPDPFGDVVAALRACEPVTADVLAMHVVAGLGRDSIARVTGHEPTEVLALVQQGQDRLTLPLQALVGTARMPGTPGEVSDLPAALRLFATRFRLPRPSGHAAQGETAFERPLPATSLLATPLLDTATLASPLPPEGPADSPGAPTVVDLRTWDAAPPTAPRVVMRHSLRPEGPSRLTRAGAAVAAWTITVGGIGVAAAMSGVIPAAVDNLFGDDGKGPVVTAQGPTRPGGTPSQPDEGVDGPPRTPDAGSDPERPSEPRSVDGPSVGDDVIVTGFASADGTTASIVLVSAAMTQPSAPPAQSPSQSPPAAPGLPGVTPPTSTPPAPGNGSGSGNHHGNGNRPGKGQSKHDNGHVKGQAKGAKTTAKAKAAKAKAAKARAAKAKAAKAKAKAARARAAKAKADKCRAAEARARATAMNRV